MQSAIIAEFNRVERKLVFGIEGVLKLVLVERQVVSDINLEIKRLLLRPLGTLWLFWFVQILLLVIPSLVARLPRKLRH